MSDNTVTLGIDIGGTNTKYGLVDKSGNILIKNKISTNGVQGAKMFFNYLCKSMEKISNLFLKITN